MFVQVPRTFMAPHCNSYMLSLISDKSLSKSHRNAVSGFSTILISVEENPSFFFLMKTLLFGLCWRNYLSSVKSERDFVSKLKHAITLKKRMDF